MQRPCPWRRLFLRTPLPSMVAVGVLALAGLSAGLDRAWAVDVVIQMPETVPNTGVTKVTVTLSPSPSPEPVVLTLRCIDGRGEATFQSGGQSQVTITESTTLDVAAGTLSTWEDNMLLDATVGGTMVAGARFTVVDLRMLSRARALELALAAVGTRRRPGNLVDVELQGTTYRVTLGARPDLTEEGPTRVGGSFQAIVALDAFTGAVLYIEGSV